MSNIAVGVKLLFYFWQSFAVEILAENIEDVDYDTVKTQLIKAGGANYGTGAGS